MQYRESQFSLNTRRCNKVGGSRLIFILVQIYSLVKLSTFIRFLDLIRQQGKFRSKNGFDFNRDRLERLVPLRRYCPVDDHSEHGIKTRIVKNPYLRPWVADAAYIKQAIKPKGGHLTVVPLGICYIRIPRAASTSISYSMLGANFPELKNDSPSVEQINALTDVHLRRRLTDNEKQMVFFTAVRNPFERIVSVYREFFEQKRGHFIYEDYLFGILRRNLSFKEFAERVKLIPDVLKDQHLKPQHHFLRFYEQNKLAVRILKLEQPEILKDFLHESGLNFDTLNQSDTPYDYRQYYDPDTVRAVKSIYAGDVTRFGYEHIAAELLYQ